MALGDTLTQRILSNWRTAPIDEKLKASLGFLEKLTLSPDCVDSEDVPTLRAAGLTDRAITDAIYICIGFNIINRIADALGFKLPPPERFGRGAKIVFRFGYKLMSGTWFESGGRQHSLVNENNSPVDCEAMGDPYESMFKQLTETVLCGPGELDPEVRKAASQNEKIPGALGPYVQRVVERAYTVTDQDITVLREDGYSEDQIFEATVSAALGAGLVRLKSGIGALRARER